MKKTFYLIYIFLIIATMFSCSNQTNSIYNKEIDDWRNARIDRLKSKTGWLNLAGLYWLKEGDNTFGADSSNQIVFPENAPAFLGSIIKNKDSIILKAYPGEEIRIDSILVTEKSINDDSSGKPSLMESGNFAWFIIKRDGRYGIRLRDYNHPRIAKLDHIPCYETSTKWKIAADFIPFDSIRKIETATVTGGIEINNCPGKLVFRKGLKKYEIFPFSEDNKFFIIFADKTNGIDTYGNGRFLYASMPGPTNKVILDFNKAYNPPCAFSPFATCPMPPLENFLDLKIEAGEKELHNTD